jgi:hypothetical protein
LYVPQTLLLTPYSCMQVSLLLIISKLERWQALSVSASSLKVGGDDVEKPLEVQLSPYKLLCTQHTTKCGFHISDIRVTTYKIGVCRAEYLTAPFYGKFTPDRVHSSNTPVTGDTVLAIQWASVWIQKVMPIYPFVVDRNWSYVVSGKYLDIFYQNIHGLRSISVDICNNVCSILKLHVKLMWCFWSSS